ncbi:MAG TPA: MoaD/ThiS family protein [Planktothrix sp.]|jgi:molybdopterin converting factor subunit 1
MTGIVEKKVSIQYFAMLREQRGISDESLVTSAATARDLYDQLRTRHGFTLSADRLGVAINDEFAAWDRRLEDSDRIVFIPPVAGG